VTSAVGTHAIPQLVRQSPDVERSGSGSATGRKPGQRGTGHARVDDALQILRANHELTYSFNGFLLSALTSPIEVMRRVSSVCRPVAVFAKTRPK
jgi:hypothetical protein